MITAFDTLKNEMQKINNIIEDIKDVNEFFDDEGDELYSVAYDDEILKNCLYGVDLNKESVEITRLSLWLRTLSKDKPLTNLDANIKCGNSLIDDETLIGDLAFNWEKEFPEVFAQGGFDIVIGNPPYGVNFDTDTKKYLDNFDDTVPDYEIYIYFISLYKKILSKNGYLSYIFPNTFLSNLFAKDYRKDLIENTNIVEISDLSNDEVFKDAKVRTIIILLKNSNLNNDFVIFNKSVKGKIEYFEKYKYDDILNNVENISSMFLQSKEEKNIIDKIKNNYTLKNYCNISQGLIPYDKYKGQSEHIIKNRAYHSDKKLNDTYKRELKGEDIKSYYLSWNGNLWISYGEWLAAPREQKYFLEPRILIREITGDKLFCAYAEEEYYNTPSIINVINDKKDFDLKYILGILNSKLIGWYHNKTSPKANKGLFPKILVNDVRNIPIKVENNNKQQEIILYVNKIISLNKNYYDNISKFITFIKNKFNIEKISKKLSKWYDLEFSDFIKELKKNKVKLSLAEELEWQQFFEDEKNKILLIKKDIEEVDAKIDKLVYDLYEITKEEIAIIENNM